MAVPDPHRDLVEPVRLQARRAHDDCGVRVGGLERREQFDGLAEALLVGEQRAAPAQHLTDRVPLKRHERQRRRVELRGLALAEPLRVDAQLRQPRPLDEQRLQPRERARRHRHVMLDEERVQTERFGRVRRERPRLRRALPRCSEPPDRVAGVRVARHRQIKTRALEIQTPRAQPLAVLEHPDRARVGHLQRALRRHDGVLHPFGLKQRSQPRIGLGRSDGDDPRPGTLCARVVARAERR